MYMLPDSATVTSVPVSKLRPPRVRHSELTRTGLLEDPSVRDAEILAVCAPAGYGKSTLAIQWASRSGMPVAWLTCDESDSDGVVLMAGLSSALQRCGAGYRPPGGTPTLDEPAFSRTVLTRFEQSVSELSTPVIVVIDDVHLVTDEVAARVLKHFVNAVPEGSQVALVGRSLAPVPVALWRGQGRVVDLGPAELGFGTEETREALSVFGGSQSSEDEIEQVLQDSQGWPVAVFLMSQTGRSHDVTESIDEFIESEVLAQMPRRLREFVVSTAALGSVNVDLALAATGQNRSAHYLNQAITTVLLQRTHDGWFRYHPLMQDCATDYLLREDAAQLRRIRAKAAVWYLHEGHLETAVQLAIAAGDPEALAEVFWPAARLSLLHGRTAAVIQWLESIGDRTVLQIPEVGLAAAWAYIATGDFGRVLRYIESVLRALPEGWITRLDSHNVAPEVSLLFAVTGNGLSGPAECAEVAAKALAAMDPKTPSRALAQLVLGLNLTLIGDPRAEEALDRAAAVAAAGGIASTQVEAGALLGLLLMGRGEDAAGCRAVQRAADTYAFHDLAQMSSTSGVLAIAEVAHCTFRGSGADLDRAIGVLEEIRPRLEPLMPWYRPLAGGVLAFASVRVGDLEGFRRYARWCEDSDAPPGALCRQWTALAWQEFAATSPLQHLSPAELRVWDLLKGRMTLSEIGGALFLSRETVKSHTMSIYRKLGVSSRREAQELAETWS